MTSSKSYIEFTEDELRDLVSENIEYIKGIFNGSVQSDLSDKARCSSMKERQKYFEDALPVGPFSLHQLETIGRSVVQAFKNHEPHPGTQYITDVLYPEMLMRILQQLNPSSTMEELVMLSKVEPGQAPNDQSVEVVGANPPLDNVVNPQIDLSEAINPLLCVYCDKVFLTKCRLTIHRIRIHKVKVGKKMTHLCIEQGEGTSCCDSAFSSLSELKVHLTDCHNVEFIEVVEHFGDKETFLKWKTALEKQECVSFVLHNGPKRRSDKQVQYYYCHRSGIYASKNSGKRKLKDSCKMQQTCPANMKVTTSQTSGAVTVVFCNTHTGHGFQLRHIRLTGDEKMSVAHLLQLGLSSREILKRFKEMSSGSIDRLYILNSKDIQNVERCFGLRRGVERHTDDATSVRLLVEEMRSKSDNPILYCKFQGEVQSEFVNNLQDTDLLIVIQHPFQKEMMKQYGSKIICMDSTHGTNGYDFYLITVLIVDEYGEGVPVSWIISNREDAMLLTESLKLIHRETGPLTPKVFMSDDAGQYYNAWVGVYGQGPKKLLCSWHVDRAWRGKLSMIKDSYIECAVYKDIKTLLEEGNVEEFNKMHVKIQDRLCEDPCTKEFGKYFVETYSHRPEEWALCHRVGAELNTNMYVESFHRVLKHIYMKGKSNKRLDRLIFVLNSIANDKLHERIMKVVKGKQTHRIEMVESRHRSSLSMSEDLVTKIDDGFVVCSKTNNAEYLVTFNPSHTCLNCEIRCSHCKICVHAASCTCSDSLVMATICKHIHLVCRLNPQLFKSQTTDPPPQMPADLMSLPKLTELVTSKPTTEGLDASISELLSAIFVEHQQASAETKSELRRCLQDGLNLLRLGSHHNATSLPVCRDVPANKNVPLQSPFRSTKKKRCVPSRLPKPTISEKKSIKSNLLLMDVTMPESSQPEEHNYASQAASFPPPPVSTVTTSCDEGQGSVTKRSHASGSNDSRSSKKKKEFLTSKQFEYLHLIATKAAVNGVQQGKLLEEEDIIAIPEKVKDEVLDCNFTLISEFLNADAWAALQNILVVKRVLWKCAACPEATTLKPMIQCDICQRWYHWACVGIKKSLKEKTWTCSQC